MSYGEGNEFGVSAALTARSPQHHSGIDLPATGWSIHDQSGSPDRGLNPKRHEGDKGDGMGSFIIRKRDA